MRTMMRTRPGVPSSEPNAFGDDVIGVRSGTVRLTTIFKMADFDLPRQTTDNIDLMLLWVRAGRTSAICSN